MSSTSNRRLLKSISSIRLKQYWCHRSPIRPLCGSPVKRKLRALRLVSFYEALDHTTARITEIVTLSHTITSAVFQVSCISVTSVALQKDNVGFFIITKSLN